MDTPLLDVLGAEDSNRLLEALAQIRERRAELDQAERALIEAARERKVGWARIAAALGVSSRQAAEQRLLRLSAGQTRDPVTARAFRAAQRTVDNGYGESIVQLRAAAVAAHRAIAAVSDWDTRHPRAQLARKSLELAISAAPGALYDLTMRALDDFAAMSTSELPNAVTDALRQLGLTVEGGSPKI